MIQILWQYRVKEASRGRFELAYGPGGAWSQLFAGAPGYRGTALLRDAEHPGTYLTIDVWDSEEEHLAFLDEHGAAYETMDALMSELVEDETKIGAFKILAEATVRPGRGGRKARNGSHRKSR